MASGSPAPRPIECATASRTWVSASLVLVGSVLSFAIAESRVRRMLCDCSDCVSGRLGCLYARLSSASTHRQRVARVFYTQRFCSNASGGRRRFRLFTDLCSHIVSFEEEPTTSSRRTVFCSPAFDLLRHSEKTSDLSCETGDVPELAEEPDDLLDTFFAYRLFAFQDGQQERGETPIFQLLL